MRPKGLKLSILDRSPINGGETSAEALQHTIELAQQAEMWGYHRFWVSEHHGSERVMGSSPEVLISHILAKTERIRVGSGGVMLQHYSPYKVAENFNVLASLAPGRVDLGIGRGPGGLPRSTKALRVQDEPDPTPFAEKIRELQRFLQNRLEEEHPLFGLQASPLPPEPAPVFLLGTSPASAVMAAELGLPYVFALFLNSDESAMDKAVATYRDQFDCGQGSDPLVMLALPVILADTDETARSFAAELKVIRVHLASGRTFTLTSEAAAQEFGRQSQEEFTIEINPASVIYGSPKTARHQLEELQDRYAFDELIAVTAIDDFEQRLRSFELLGELLGQLLGELPDQAGT